MKKKKDNENKNVNGNLIIFVGAGVSVNSGVINYKNLIHIFVEKLGIKKEIKILDFLCWSHIDVDHSYDIDNLLNHVNKNTKFFCQKV